MADPEQALLVRRVEIAGKELGPDQVVWVHARGSSAAEVEYRGRHGRIPLDAIVPYPVKGPGLVQLRELDGCFGEPDEAFVVEHQSAEHLYEILRCRAHGKRFLRDTRGTIAWYSTLTLLGDDEDEPPDAIWARYHGKSNGWLMLEGRTR